MTVATLSHALTDWMLYELQGTGFTYDPVSLRYRDKRTGRYVAESKVINLVSGGNKDSYDSFIADSMKRHTKRYLDGGISIQEWQSGMRRDIKDLHIISATAGKGGREMMTQADWGRTGNRLRQQYAYIDSFAWELAAGDVSDAKALQRAGMYAGTSKTAYGDGRTASAKELGFTEERRVLHPAEHCPDCIAYAALGWQPVGTLPEPGQASQCLTNCKCTKEYQGKPEGAQEIFIIGGKKFIIPDEPRVSKPKPTVKAKRKPKTRAKAKPKTAPEPVAPVKKRGKKATTASGIPVTDNLAIIDKKARARFGDESLRAIDSVHGDGKLPRLRAYETTDGLRSKAVQGEYRTKLGEDADYNLVKKVDQITISPNAKRPHITMVHETGHYIDDWAFGTDGFASETSDKTKAWRTAVHKSGAFKELTDRRDNPENYQKSVTAVGKTFSLSTPEKFLNYASTDRELWARSYAQYITESSDSGELKKELRDAQKTQRFPLQWSSKDFAPIKEAFDTIFQEQGWRN